MIEIREQLSAAEDTIRALREEKARAVKVADAAKAAAAESESDTTFAAAMAAKEQVQAVERKLEAESEVQVNLLRKLGDREAGMAGFTWPNADGWAVAASKLNLGRGELRADVSAQSLLAPSPPPARVPAAAAPTTSNRWLYPVFERVPFGDSGDLVSTDYVVTFTDPASAVTGVEIPPATDTTKATLPMSASLATPTARTFAVVAEALPATLFNNQRALQSYLQVEMARRLAEAFDEHVVGKIEAAAPPTGSTGVGLVAQIRNAIADMRNLGGEPTVLALTPTDAALLDLSTDGEGHYVFRVDLEGSGAPAWSLRVREAPSVSDPLLISPSQLGVSYSGEGSVLADPYSSMKTNQVRCRAEAEGCFHVRNIEQGAFAIA